MSGCSHDMALTKGVDNVDLSSNSIALLTAKIKNQNKPDSKLGLTGTFICPPTETCSSLSSFHEVESQFNDEDDDFREYLFSFELETGTYNIHALMSNYLTFFIGAGAKVPLNLKAEIKSNTVTYLGHIDVILRTKQSDDEERAALFPLLDAAVAGYSTGTFDVVVEDRFDEDMKLFITEYPGLKKVKVEKYILPHWVRPEYMNDK